MGGWHIVHRTTKDVLNNKFYKGITTDIKLPERCDSKDDDGYVFDGVFPEFIHGFYKNNYGIDVGIVFRKSKFKLFYSALSSTASVKYEEKIISDVNKGDTIRLVTYIDNNKIIAKVLKNNRTKASITAYLKNGAANSFRYGAIINREIVMAANRSDYIPTPAFFSDTTMYNSTLTTMNYQYLPLSGQNSRTLPAYSDDGYIDGSRYGRIINDNGTFSSDTGSCNFSN